MEDYFDDNFRTITDGGNLCCLWSDQCGDECTDWFLDCDDYDTVDIFEDDLVHYAIDLGMRAAEYQAFIDEMEGDA